MAAARPAAAPRVSVVVPAYNGAQLLSRTLDTVLDQTLSEFELIVFDDGSTDATADVGDGYARADPRIRVVRATNGGVARARNRGFAATDGRSEYVVFLDQDDRWFPETLTTMVGTLEDRPDFASVYGLARCIDSEGRAVPGDDMEDRMRERFEYRGRHLVPIGPHEPTTFAGLMFHNYPVTPGLHLMRRNVVERVGPFDPDVVPADDWDMAIRMSRFGPIGFVDRLVLEWRRHPNAQSASAPGWRKATFRVRAKAYAAPENTLEQRQLARTAYLAISRDALGRAWSTLQRRQPGAAARDLAKAADNMFQYAAVAAPLWARGTEPGQPRWARP